MTRKGKFKGFGYKMDKLVKKKTKRTSKILPTKGGSWLGKQPKHKLKKRKSTFR